MTSLFSFSQNKNVEVVSSTDEFSNVITKTTDAWSSIGESKNKNRLTAYMKYTGEILFLYLLLPADLGCLVEKQSKLEVKLKNDDVVQFIYYNKTDCGRYSNGAFLPLAKEDLTNTDFKNIMLENIEKLKSSPWNAIRLTGSEYFTNILPRNSKSYPDPELFFIDHLKALNL
jgi:hypothetical protein